ncbi:MAG: DUF2075 domain-containing protein [Spirochaetia bacterium]|nr:DUF2075 domain-containing protein [Spirochaetia bacterium]
MIDRYFYENSFSGFLSQSNEEIFGILSSNNNFNLVLQQKDAWLEEIPIMKDLIKHFSVGRIIFEYSIPRLGKRIDVVLLFSGIVFVLEFKIGEKSFLTSDVEQVWDYALDLKNFHEASHDKIIIPVLIATDAKERSYKYSPCRYDDKVFEPICTNNASLYSIIRTILDSNSNDNEDLLSWANSRYSPTPTIIQAASALFNNHSVEEITRKEASDEDLIKTNKFVIDVITKAKTNKEKAICFVTGVPGAGKTLVGLQIAIEQFDKTELGKRDLAVYLSGNYPLVSVLTESLARDKKRKEEQKNKKKYPITKARRDVHSFIQIVHHYRNTFLEKIKDPIQNGIIEIDESKIPKYKDDGYAEVEHVAIFDEAQRAWTQEQLSSWLKRKKHISNFPYSEPEFLIWSLDQRPDWAVIICLVGGGQEINTGEAGIAEWINALNNKFAHWKVYISNQLTEKEYAEGKVKQLISKNINVIENPYLHLSVSMRSFRSEKLSTFVHELLDLNIKQAQSLYGEIKNVYPIVLTRSLNAAKKWLREKARGSERYGMIVSSQAYRLKPLAIDVRFKPDTVHWFLDDKNDIRSSLFLEDVATEFDIQGLELDWSCIIWDGDFRYSNSGWKNYSFTGSKWKNIRANERKIYQLNAYRVLLTRARRGMIIVVPEGSDEDETRLPDYYDPTYEYLKQIGLETI